jgi:hypothetical protein
MSNTNCRTSIDLQTQILNYYNQNFGFHFIMYCLVVLLPSMGFVLILISNGVPFAFAIMPALYAMFLTLIIFVSSYLSMDG